MIKKGAIEASPKEGGAAGVSGSNGSSSAAAALSRGGLGQHDISLGQHKTDSLVIRELKALYKEKLLPIERSCQFNKFHHPEIYDAELMAKPTVLLVGQYSTGKTTFIKHLIGMDYPEIHIGPEPTTDRFIAVVYGNESKTIKGNALTGVNDLPFSGLSTFGTSFLNKFSAAVVPAPALAHMNIIDTPGVLSGEKQRAARNYDFPKVCRWFAERSDLILLMFDCSKLDISDEFKSVIEELQPHEDKVHCVLNKADQLDTESLMRVYGALLWSLGRIFKGAEVARIYVGSFRDEPLLRDEHIALFHKDEEVLKKHLEELPKACSMRKVNEMVKRVRLAVVHLCVLGHLRSRMPFLWGKEATQTRLIERLQEVFEHVRTTYQLSEGDFPKLDEFKAKLQISDFSTFPLIDRKTLMSLQALLVDDIPRIVAHVAGMASLNLPGGDKTGAGAGGAVGGLGGAGSKAGGEGDEGEETSSTVGDDFSNRTPKIFTISPEAEGEYSPLARAAIVLAVTTVLAAGLYLSFTYLLDKETQNAVYALARAVFQTFLRVLTVSLTVVANWIAQQKEAVAESLDRVGIQQQQQQQQQQSGPVAAVLQAAAAAAGVGAEL